MLATYRPPHGVSEGVFTTWNLTFNEIIDPVNRSSAPYANTIIINEVGNKTVSVIDADNNNLTTVNIDGSNYQLYNNLNILPSYDFNTSIKGTYVCYSLNASASTTPMETFVFTKGKLAWSYISSDLLSTNSFSVISLSGRYVVVAGPDSVNNLRMRLEIFEGA
ncbi:MAG: hypothetical protein QXI37_03295 [Thermoprotei archaeon]